MIGHTVINRYCIGSEYAESEQIRSVGTTPQENLLEYAARVCYESVKKQGNNPGFIKSIMDRRHMDVIEHVVATFGGLTYDQTAALRMENPHVYHNKMGSIFYNVTANMRVWRELARKNHLPRTAMEQLSDLCPTVIESIEPDAIGTAWAGYSDDTYDPIETENAIVTLLAFNKPVRPELMTSPYDRHFTFMIDGISLAAIPHLIRHRKGSYSQRSMRYVDAMGDKASVSFVKPKSWSDKMGDWNSISNGLGEDSMRKYQEMRDAGIPKEDARYILPLATNTRIITSMHYIDWMHFIELRTAKAAQWEIRGIANAIESLVSQVCA